MVVVVAGAVAGVVAAEVAAVPDVTAGEEPPPDVVGAAAVDFVLVDLVLVDFTLVGLVTAGLVVVFAALVVAPPASAARPANMPVPVRAPTSDQRVSWPIRSSPASRSRRRRRLWGEVLMTTIIVISNEGQL